MRNLHDLYKENTIFTESIKMVSINPLIHGKTYHIGKLNILRYLFNKFDKLICELMVPIQNSNKTVLMGKKGKKNI
jgi:hypothetical protein